MLQYNPTPTQNNFNEDGLFQEMKHRLNVVQEELQAISRAMLIEKMESLSEVKRVEIFARIKTATLATEITLKKIRNIQLTSLNDLIAEDDIEVQRYPET